MLLDGDIWFKTDDDELFEESLEYFPEAGFRITTMTRDLHSEPELRYFETEHEQMFDEMGKKDQVFDCRAGSCGFRRIFTGIIAVQRKI